jgi:hypothetical protein
VRKREGRRKGNNNVLRNSIFSQFASNSGLFVSTERNLSVQVVNTVDLEDGKKIISSIMNSVSLSEINKVSKTYPSGSSMKLVSSLDCTVDVLSKDGSCKPIHYFVTRKRL